MTRFDDLQEEALGRFLGPLQPASEGPHSPLDAALHDARAVMENSERSGGGLWLATLGYLVVAQIIGRTIAKKPNTPYLDRGPEWQQFRAGLLEFAPRPSVTENQREALWALRCALAHHWNLRHVERKKSMKILWLFELSQDDRPLTNEFKVRRLPPNQTPGDVDGTRVEVNIREVARHIEEVVAYARSEHRARPSRVQLAPGADVDEVRLGSFITVPPGAPYVSRLSSLDSTPAASGWVPKSFRGKGSDRSRT